MTTNLAATALETSTGEESQLEGGDSRDHASDSYPPVLFSNWPAPAPRPVLRRSELAAVLVLSAVLHAGIATAAYNNDDAPQPKRISRVEIDLARPPEKPKPIIPAAVPPPPPKVVKQELKPAVTTPVNTPVEPPPVEQPIDTGSSAPAEEGGELFAGNGGLGNAPPPPPAPVAPTPAVVAAPVVQAREGANYAKNPRPAYPRQAKREGWEGTTLLRVSVQPSGKPGAVKLQKSSGHDVLDEAAIAAVEKWTFTPATQGGSPIGGSVTVPIVFRLQ
jgi:periplasmic protein TonB